MPDFLEEKRTEINDRIAELKPLVDEYARLEAAAAALDGGPSDRRPGATTKGRRPGGPRGSKSRISTPAKGEGGRGRPSRRGAEALAFIREHPGITIPELAANMGIKHNYLYRVLPGLGGQVTKKGRGWHPSDA